MSSDANNEMRGLLRYVSQSKLELMRNLAFAGSGTLVANILLLTQIGTPSIPLKVSLYASVITIPFWVCLASVYEAYLFRGPRSYSHLRSNFTLRLHSLLNLIAAVGLYIAICAVVWHLDFYAAVALVLSSAVALIATGIHNDDLKRALTTRDESDA